MTVSQTTACLAVQLGDDYPFLPPRVSLLSASAPGAPLAAPIELNYVHAGDWRPTMTMARVLDLACAAVAAQ